MSLGHLAQYRWSCILLSTMVVTALGKFFSCQARYINFNPVMHNLPNGQTYFKSLAGFVAMFLKSV